MPLQLKTPTERLAGMVPLLLQRGADLVSGVVNGKPPTIKSALVTAALEAYQNQLAADIRAALQQTYAAHECIEGPRGEAADYQVWNEAIENDAALALDEFIKFAGADAFSMYVTGAMFDQPDGIDRMSAILAEQATKLLKPAGPQMGKFLSAIGIAQPHIDEAEKLAAHQQKLYGADAIAKDTAPVGVQVGGPPPAPPAPPAAPGFVPPPPVSGIPLPPAAPGMVYSPATGPLTSQSATLLPPERFVPPSGLIVGIGAAPFVGAPIPGAPRPEPDKAAIKQAFALWYGAAQPNLDNIAKLLEMSASTLRNRCTGRAEGKLSAKQAGLLLAGIDAQIVDLTAAAAIFSAIRS